jgi:LacI family transcriptional regulator
MNAVLKPSSERRAVSQSAIAREAGVARTTVSLALRGGEGLTPETVERVITAARRLGYRPNKLVQALRSGRTRLVGVMVPPTDSYWSDVLRGIHDGLIARDYVPLALWSEYRRPPTEESTELRQIKRLIDWRVDGAILWPWFANLYQEHFAELKRHDLPLVTIDMKLPDAFHADAVLSDEAMGAEAIAGHLTGLGHRKILHCAGPASESWSRERRACFEEVAARTPGVELHFVELSFSKPHVEVLREALRALPQVTAVFCATDKVAEEVYDIARELGRRIPEDLSVVGYGNLDFGSRLDPPLTTVRHRPFRMGMAAANLILDRVEAAEQPPPRVERLPVEFVPRSSTAAAVP